MLGGGAAGRRLLLALALALPTLRTTGPAAPPTGQDLTLLRNPDGKRRFEWIDGKLIQRKLDSSQTYPRSIKKGDSLGTPIMQALRREMNKRDVPRLHEMLVTKLLKDGDRVCGAIALDFQFHIGGV